MTADALPRPPHARHDHVYRGAAPRRRAARDARAVVRAAAGALLKGDVVDEAAAADGIADAIEQDPQAIFGKVIPTGEILPKKISCASPMPGRFCRH